MVGRFTRPFGACGLSEFKRMQLIEFTVEAMGDALWNTGKGMFERGCVNKFFKRQEAKIVELELY